mgnify:CR=1 FL=1
MIEENVPTFKRSFWGYKPAEVKKEITRVNELFLERKKEQQMKLGETENELKSQRQELEAARLQLKEYTLQEHTVVESLTSAKTSAAVIEEKAWQESRNIVNNALKEVETQKNNLAILKHQYESFRNDFVTVLQRYSSSLVDADKPEECQGKPAAEKFHKREDRIS